MVLLLELEHHLISRVRVQERRRVDRIALGVTNDNGVCRTGSSTRRRAVTSFESCADRQSLLLERVEFGTGVYGEDHACTAVTGVETRILCAVRPDRGFLSR